MACLTLSRLCAQLCSSVKVWCSIGGFMCQEWGNFRLNMKKSVCNISTSHCSVSGEISCMRGSGSPFGVFYRIHESGNKESNRLTGCCRILNRYGPFDVWPNTKEVFLRVCVRLLLCQFVCRYVCSYLVSTRKHDILREEITFVEKPFIFIYTHVQGSTMKMLLFVLVVRAFKKFWKWAY